MGQYQGYERYKDSGVEWLGEIPAHWDIDRLKWSVDCCKNGIWGSEPDGELDLIVLRVADFDRNSFTVNDEDLTLRAIEEKDRGSRLLNKGDLLLEKSGGGEKQLVGCVVQYNHDFPAVTSNFVARMTPSNLVNSRFLTYVHAHLYSGHVNYCSIKQTTGIQNLDSQHYLDQKMAYPPLEEQNAIAQFLDSKTSQIDTLIAKKEALLEKLDEKRTALISHAVTKGLDSTVPMKDSGIEWLGDIPAHWDVIPIKFSLAMPITDGPHETPELFDEGIPFISAESIKNDSIDFEKKRGFISKEEHERFSRKYKPQYGDVYMVKSGATTGNVARVQTHHEFNIWSPLAALRPNSEKTTTDFLFYIIKSKPFFYSVEQSWSFGTQQNIGMGVIANIRIAFPPLEEQNAIAQFLNQKTAEIDKQKNKIQQAIDLLKEYRTALITNAVTGKIDVRQVLQ